MLSQDDRERIERRALEISAAIEAENGGQIAELADSSPRWHALIVWPNQEERAIKYLSARGFGVFDPFIARTRLVRGRQRTYRERLLPGYIFIFVWDSERNYDRVMNCPHVIEFARTVNGTLVTISDKEVERHEGQAIDKSPGFQEVMKSDRATRKQKKGYRKATTTTESVEIPCLLPYSAMWDEIEGLDSDERVDRFRRAFVSGFKSA